jgi:glycerol uptake facilitator-like aquaporin
VSASLGQRVAAEFTGTALLVATVVGSGIMASRLSPGDVGLQLLENSIATGAALVALILCFQQVSAAFNPVVTLAGLLRGDVARRDAVALMAAQVAGAIAGSIVANLMFDLSAVSIAQHDRSGAHLWMGEFVATFGLVLVILRSSASHVAFAVGGYIAAAYWFTSSTSFANPAVTVGRIFSDTFAGIAPASVPMFVVMQVLGASVAVALARFLDRPALKEKSHEQGQRPLRLRAQRRPVADGGRLP